MALSRFSLYTLLLMLVAVGYLSFEIVRPFLSSFVWAVFLAVVSYPVYGVILRHVRSKRFASAVTVTIVCFGIIGPLTVLLYLLLKEISVVSTYLQNTNFEPKSILDHPMIRSVIETLFPFFGINNADFDKLIRTSISGLGKWIAAQAPKGAAGIFGAIFDFTFMTIILFFLFVDGIKRVDRFLSYLPFSEKRREKLKNDVQEMVTSAIHGGLFTALTHAFFGAAAFAIVRLPSPLLLGLTVGITAFIPAVGSLIVWVPSIVYLAMSGHLGRAVFLTAVGGAGIIVIDYVLRPIVIRGGAKTPFLLIFLGVFGGLELFGLMGIVLGPLVLVIFLSLINLTREIESSPLRSDRIGAVKDDKTHGVKN